MKIEPTAYNQHGPAGAKSPMVSRATSAAAAYGIPSPPDSPMHAARLCQDANALQQQRSESTGTLGRAEAEIEARARRLSIADPVPWGQFKRLVDLEDLGPLGRSYPGQIRYEHRKDELIRQYGSIATYLMDHVLADFIAETQAVGFDRGGQLTAHDFMFRPNDFPYYLGDGVEHWVMWCKKELVPGFVAPMGAAQAIANHFGCGIEWRFFVNPIHRQSVPQLSHAHVFVYHSGAKPTGKQDP